MRRLLKILAMLGTAFLGVSLFLCCAGIFIGGTDRPPYVPQVTQEPSVPSSADETADGSSDQATSHVSSPPQPVSGQRETEVSDVIVEASDNEPDDVPASIANSQNEPSATRWVRHERKTRYDLEELKHEAHVIAENFVLKNLKYPDDADFVFGASELRFTGYVEGYPSFKITGKVRAANAFGARLTHPYQVELTKIKIKWFPTHIQIGDELMFKYNTLREDLNSIKEEDRNQQLAVAKEIEDQKEKERLRELAIAEEIQAQKKKILADQAKWRLWTSSTGSQLDAKFLKQIDQTVYLMKRDETTLKISVDRLSTDDLEFIKHRMWLKIAEDELNESD